MWISKYHFDRLLNRIETLEVQVRELRHDSEIAVPDTRDLGGEQGYTTIKTTSVIVLILRKLGLKYNKQLIQELVKDE